jgi:hypothetical protein
MGKWLSGYTAYLVSARSWVQTPIPPKRKLTKAKRARGVAHVVECHLSSIRPWVQTPVSLKKRKISCLQTLLTKSCRSKIIREEKAQKPLSPSPMCPVLCTKFSFALFF